MSAEQYTPDYFINKFKAIPEDQWSTGTLTNDNNGAHCALFFVGTEVNTESGDYIYTTEGQALENLFKTYLDETTWKVNDCVSTKTSTARTPKTRILNALKKVKKLIAK